MKKETKRYLKIAGLMVLVTVVMQLVLRFSAILSYYVADLPHVDFWELFNMYFTMSRAEMIGWFSAFVFLLVMAEMIRGITEGNNGRES